MTLFHGWQIAWLFAAALLAGIVNAVAGGGSVFSFLVLMGVGDILPVTADATNTVAVWPGQLMSIVGFFPDLKQNLPLVFPTCTATLAGSLAGAFILMNTRQRAFMALIPWLLLFATLLFASSGFIARWAVRKASRTEGRKPRIFRLCLALAVIGLYLGYFGAGGGLLLIASLAVFGIENINQINALKVAASTVGTGAALVTFIVEKRVAWWLCIPMMAGSALGGYLGARYSRQVNPNIVRIFVIAVGAASSAYFFWKV